MSDVGRSSWAAGLWEGAAWISLVAACAVTLWAASLDPVSYAATGGDVWLVWIAFCLSAAMALALRVRSAESFSGTKRFALLPLVILAVVALQVARLPAQWRFDASTDALDRAAAQSSTYPTGGIRDVRIGWYSAAYAGVQDDSFTVSLGDSYLVHDPVRGSPYEQPAICRRMNAHWWACPNIES